MKYILRLKYFIGFVIILSAIGVIVFSFKKPSPEIKKETPPNLLIVLVDQWAGQAMGFENKEPVFTPNLDALSKKSLVLEQMVSNYPVCSPARAM